MLKHSKKRFIEKYSEGKISGFKIIVDSHTGVNYLYAWSSYGSGITTLLDANGNITITPTAE